MKNRYMLGLSLLLITSALYAEPSAQKLRPEPPGSAGRFSERGPRGFGAKDQEPGPMQQAMRELNLNDEQRAKLGKMMKAKRESGAQNPRMEVMQAVQELNGAIAEGSDEKIASCVERIRTSALKAAKTSREFQEILNEEQRAKFAHFRERMEERKTEFRRELKGEMKQRFQEKRGWGKPVPGSESPGL